jgi:zinc protease
VLIASCVGLAAWSRLDPDRGPCCFALGAASLDAPIQTDPYLRSDTLANGLRYYVRQNSSASRRAEVRLVVDAGSVLEDDDQRGLAHAVEHMVFRGTRGFPGRTIDQYLESLGMRRGEGANAVTTLDETVFRLTLPADRPRALDTALAMLAGMAHDAVFDPADARGEAGVVLEEWRSKRDAGQRVTDDRQAILLAGSPYAARPVIGDTAVLRRFDLRAMRRFYDRWYRPEAMAVIVVGTIDPDEAQDLVARHFGRIPRGVGPARRTERVVAPVTGLRASVLTDVEATGTRVAIWHPRPARRFRVRSDYRAALVSGLWRAILSTRLEEAADTPGSPIVSTGVGSRLVARPLTAEVVSAMTTRDRALPTLDLLTAEMEHLARDGATPEEVEQHAATILEQARSSADAGEASDDLAAEFVDHFLTGNAPITDRAAYELARDLLPTISAGDVTAFARGRTLDSGAVVILTAASDAAAAGIRPADLVARARASQALPVSAHDAPVETGPLLAREPVRGRIAAERAIPEVQAWEWTLSNGMRVILKPTRFTFDEIQLRAVAPGGASLASDPDYPSAWLSDAIVQSTGIGTLSGTRLGRLLDTTSISLAPTVGDDAIMLGGSTAPDDLETFFQLVHLYFTAPRRDTVAFRRYRDRMVTATRDRERDPDSIFLDTLAAAVTGHHPRGLTNGTRFYESANLPAALAFWTARMSNAAAFTVVLTGDFTLSTMRPLVERYLASLPAGRREQPRDVGSRPNAAVVRRDVVAGIAGRARTRLVLSGPVTVTSRAVEDLKEVRDVLESALDQRLRETLGGTYGVTVESDVDLLPPYHYSIAIDFEAAPQRIDSLAAVALTEVERLRMRGPTPAEFDATRAARIHDYDGRLESNEYWSSELSYHARLGWPLATIATHRQDVEGLTAAELRQACATYLGTRPYTRVTLRPRTARVASGGPRARAR